MAPEADRFARLKSLVERNRSVNAPGDEAPVAAQRAVADEVLPALLESGVTSDLLAQRITAEPAKEYVLALATLIAARPGPGDAKRLFDAVELRLGTAALRADSQFILDRVLLAVVALEDKRLLPPPERARARALAGACRADGDPPLRRRADAVLTMLGDSRS